MVPSVSAQMVHARATRLTYRRAYVPASVAAHVPTAVATCCTACLLPALPLSKCQKFFLALTGWLSLACPFSLSFTLSLCLMSGCASGGGYPPPLLLQWAFHGRGGYTPPDALAVVRRHVASICDRSFDLISILGKIDFEPNSYIGIKVIFFENRCLKIDLSQTAPPKMTAMTIG